ncbi:MAG: hypothetical protein ACRD2C_22925 [Acidimicrobiales bacterium]
MTPHDPITDPAGIDTAEVPLRPWEGAAFMATGAALVVHIVVDVPLWLSVAVAATAAGCVIALAVHRHPGGTRAGRRVITVGTASAVAALVAYDGTRLAISTGLGYEVGPFDAFRHFGAGLVGSSASNAARWTAGTLFHITNGITFGIAYTIVAGRRGVVAGVLFGLGLEAAMIAFYPAWLQIPNLREFVSMSIVGHAVYGAVLGVAAQHGLRRFERAGDDDRATTVEGH